MIIFLGPHAPLDRRHADHQVVRALENLIEAAYSRLPEHAAARTHVVELNHRSMQVARNMAVALPDEWQEFWQAYAGWFAMYSVAPLLANAEVARQALEGTRAREALLVEDWRTRGWWSGRDSLEGAVRDCLEAAGLRVTMRPGARLRSLRGPIAQWMAGRYGAAELRDMARSATGSALEEPPPQADVLWLAAGASSVDLIARLRPMLAQHALTSGILDFDYFGSRQALQRVETDTCGLGDFLTGSDLESARRWHREARRMWPEVARRMAGAAWPDDITGSQRRAIVDRLRLVLRRDAAAWRLKSLAAQRALAALNPRVVVAFHSYGPAVAPMVIAAQDSGVPRVCLQHGVIGPRYLALPCLPYDETLVFGDYARQIMLQACPDLPATVTGHALYDVAEQPVTPRPEVLALKQGVDGLVLLCTQFNEPAYYRGKQWWMQGVAEACRRLGARLALKLHPSDSPTNISLYRKLVQDGDDSVVLIPHGTYPLNELLVACDLMVTRDSTVVFEANLLDKPVITINLSQWDEELPYAATGGALGVYQYDHIAPALQSVLRDESVRRDLAERRGDFLAQHVGPNDGQATERIAGMIAQWARGGRPGKT